jgi:hypothetical protein
MHKHAAATAVALITMLTLAVSVSVAPANAHDGIVHFQCNGNICMVKCETELWYTAKLWDGTRNSPESCPPLLQACIITA